jgi:hypothetical protein
MKNRARLGIVGAIAALALLSAQTASAATEAGNGCEGNNSTEGATILATANAPGSPLPALIPASGVITRWTFKVLPIPPNVITQTLKIFRPTGVVSQFQTIGESAPTPVAGGLNTLSTRIPVHAGDYLGLTGAIVSEPGKSFAIYCTTPNLGDRVGVFIGSPTTGTTVTSIGEEGKLQIPVTAVVEPDADNDGFGDETQDKCPQSASTQGECPTIKLDLSSAVKKKGSVVVSITATSEAPVKVAGTVKLGKGKTAKLSGGKHTVKPGKISRFTLKFPSKLKAALADLSKSKSLKLKVTASATDLIGRVSKDLLKVKLKGQG